MAKIISTKKLKYDARDISKEATIELEVVGFKYLMDERYLVTVRDIAIIEETITIESVEMPTEIPGETEISPETYETVETPTPIALRDKVYSKDDIDNLFILAGESITPEESFTERFELLIIQSLLKITQLDPIYGSLAEDWEIVNKG